MSEETAPGILIEGASKTYPSLGGSRVAVRDVSLRVERGTIHGLLGPNGAGKTTTLKMLLGLVRPSAGRFEVCGLPSRRPSGRADLGFLPEQPYFPDQLSGEKTLRFHGSLAGIGRDRLAEEVPRLLDAVGLAGHGHVQLAKYSRGMLQRLGLAQALLGDPEVVVLDEPASGLDPVGQRDVRNLMLGLRERGKTVLLSSHQLSEVEAVCDRVSILNRGVVAAEGHIDELLNVEGRTSLRVRGAGESLPAAAAEFAEDVAFSGSTWVFSVRDESVRRAVEALYDAGWAIESLAPKRESLEDYFARLLEAPAPEAGDGAREVA